MLKIICDKCGHDCDRVGYELRVAAIHNPVPLYPTDIGELKITDDTTQIRCVVCQECYKKLGLPNIYEVARTGEIFFRCEDDKR